MTNDIRPDRLAIFSHAYYVGLTEAVLAHPDDYTPNMVASARGEDVSFGGVGAVHQKMIQAIQAGTYNHDGRGIKLACKALGIKHTRKAITTFLAGV